MASDPGDDQDSVRLSDDSAAVLLKRATQLDAASASKVSIAELRAAARDAGIAPEAFEQALAEFRAAGATMEAKPAARRRGPRYWLAGVVVTALLLAYMLLRLVGGPASLP
jgi:hypothetical protein